MRKEEDIPVDAVAMGTVDLNVPTSPRPADENEVEIDSHIDPPPPSPRENEGGAAAEEGEDQPPTALLEIDDVFGLPPPLSSSHRRVASGIEAAAAATAAEAPRRESEDAPHVINDATVVGRRASADRGRGGSTAAAAEQWVRDMARNAPLAEVTATRRVGRSLHGSPGRRWDEARRCRLCAAAALSVAIVAAASGAAAIMARRRGGGGDDPGAARASARFRKLRRVASSVSDEGALSDPESPQFSALAWLADVDELQLPPERRVAVLQRYVMALLYYSTDGDGWENKDLFSTTLKRCTVPFYMCPKDYEMVNMSWSNETAFLSATHECMWRGVGCHQHTDIVGSISMMDSNLMGPIPEEIGSLKLKYLQLGHNNLVGSIPDSFGELGGWIQRIDLSNNMLTGSMPNVFDALPNLYTFGAIANRLTGTIPETFRSLEKLKALTLGMNNLNGSIPLAFDKLLSLERLFVPNNMLSGTIPDTIRSCTSAISLILGNNDMTGTVPESLGELPNLKFLNLHGMHLNGTIPSKLFDNDGILGLALSSNVLTGTIPENAGGPNSSMFLLSLELNHLTGTIPASIGDLPDLWSFSAHSNSLTGTIPVEIGDSPSLEYLDLGNNRLVGTISGSFAQATSLKYLSISRNDLTGSMNFLCDLDIPSMSADCKPDAAEVECDCCLFCCSDEEEKVCNKYLQSVVNFQRYCLSRGGLSAERSVCGI